MIHFYHESDTYLILAQLPHLFVQFLFDQNAERETTFFVDY